MVPPHHYHINQSEHFRIISGTVNLFKGLAAEPWKVLSDREDFEKTAMIPKKVYHRIENASSTEPLVLDVHLSPEEYESEQRFFRNFFGYLDDCRCDKIAPSPLQLFVFLHSADTPFALPISENWIGVTLSRLFLVLMAAWGGLYWATRRPIQNTTREIRTSEFGKPCWHILIVCTRLLRV